jgi:transposase
MKDTELYRVLLGLKEPWQIEAVALSEAEETITVRVGLPPNTRLSCPECGTPGCTIKDRRERTWRHLDTCQFKTLVAAPLPRTDCPKCGVKTITPPWAQPHSRFTLLFERLAIEALLEMTTTGACRLLRLTWDEADGIMQRAVGRGLSQRDLSGLRRIGIDEKAVLKGHNYVTVVSDLDTSKVVWVGPDRTKETLEGFFQSLPPGVPAQIDAIAMDMWQPYRSVCRKWIPNAESKIVLDRFHIEKHLSQAVDAVRREEHRELTAEGRNDLKATRYAWLYRPENLPPTYQRREFEHLRNSNLRTARAWAIKEQFQRLWFYRYPGCARRFFEDWHEWAIKSRLEPMKKVAQRLLKHLPRILNYIRHGVTNARAEGINNKIQTIKKKAYGFRNIPRFINAIYFHCAGLKLHPL